MASVLNNTDIVLTHGGKDKEFSLSFLVVGREEILRTKLVDELRKQRQRRKLNYKLFTHCCESIQDVLLCKPQIQVDFIIFLIDPGQKDSLESVDADLKYIDKAFLFSRICLVLNDIGFVNYQVSIGDIWNTQEKYGCNLLVLKDINSDKLQSLADRVLKLAVAACGLKTGISLHLGTLLSEENRDTLEPMTVDN